MLTQNRCSARQQTIFRRGVRQYGEVKNSEANAAMRDF